MKLEWSVFAFSDRQGVFDYIEADSPRAAISVDDAIAVATRQLRIDHRRGVGVEATKGQPALVPQISMVRGVEVRDLGEWQVARGHYQVAHISPQREVAGQAVKKPRAGHDVVRSADLLKFD